MDEPDKENISQYLTFQLGTELFAIEVSHVKEVLEFIKITPVPGSPDYLKGMINVRGSVVPVMSLHIKMGLEELIRSINTRIIVTELQLEDEKIVLGIVADAVKEVLDINEKDIEAPPRVGKRYNTGSTKGIVTRQNDFIIILDIKCIIKCDKMKTGYDSAELEENAEGEPEKESLFA